MESVRMQRVKAESELPYIGVSISFQVVDDNIEAIIIGDGDNQIRITKPDSFSTNLRVTKPEAAKEKIVHVVTGKLLGLTDYESEEFEYDHQALSHLHEVANKQGTDEGLSVVEKKISYFEDKI